MASDNSSESGGEMGKEMYEKLKSQVEEIENASLMLDLPQSLAETLLYRARPFPNVFKWDLVAKWTEPNSFIR
jgi:hypothetical protein